MRQAFQLLVDFNEVGTPSISHLEVDILEMMDGKPEWTSAQVKQKLCGQEDTVCSVLRRMVKKGFLTYRRVPPESGRGRYPRVYRVTPFGQRMLSATRAARKQLAPEDIKELPVR